MLKATIVFLSFNQEKYVEAALRSALDQEYGDLEILVGDDASTDGTRGIIERTLGEHPRGRLARLFQHGERLGLVRNWERLVRAATGDFIIAQAGDDVSLPGRARCMASIFGENPKVMATLSQVRIIDGDSRVLRETYEKDRPRFARYGRNVQRSGLDFWCGVPIIGACAAYRRRVADDFGPLTCAPSEDEAYIYRALLLGDVAYTDEVLLEWRWHGGNLSAGSLMDERSAVTTLERRATSSLMRQKACDQHLIDLRSAHEAGRIEAEAFRLEKTKIDTVRAIQGLSYASTSPQARFGLWCTEARNLLGLECGSLSAWAYVLRSLVKRFLPLSLKLKYSRPAR
jgi:glycosyltransferase involved in cell wall biosynthesis